MNILFKKENEIGQTIFSDCKSLENEMHTWRWLIGKKDEKITAGLAFSYLNSTESSIVCSCFIV